MNAAMAYESAMLTRDAAAMARAAAQLLNKPVTEASILELNAQLRIEADDTLISAVVRAAQ